MDDVVAMMNVTQIPVSMRADSEMMNICATRSHSVNARYVLFTMEKALSSTYLGETTPA